MYDFLNGYSNSTIKPVFEKFKNELNKATKDKLSENVNRNSKQIESLSANNFIAQLILNKHFVKIFNNFIK